MDLLKIASEQKQIIAAVVAGIFAISAAYIRRDKRPEQTRTKKPVLSLLAFPVFYLILGIALLAVEFFSVNVNPDGELNLDNPGSILCLAGCVFVVAGVVWLPINLSRLVLWPTPKEPTTSSIVVAPASAVIVPPASSKKASPGK
jgi:NhaP-type Na+/H+ or K+/H+ antiporter